MISVEDALARVFALVDPVGTEDIPLSQAAGRVLRAPVTAHRDQPPFAAAAMDGYAVADPFTAGAALKVIAEVAAGQSFTGVLQPGEAVRIFTGAPVPRGATRVVIQEETRRDGACVTLLSTPKDNTHIRPQGLDFGADDTISAPRRLRPVELALLAAMNCPTVCVSKRPDVAIIATGDELVMPGETPRSDQIIASNAFALKAMAEAEGASARMLPIARDTEASLRAVFDLAMDADLILTIGGASVGDHDLVAPVSAALGATRAFYKVAMRPGKPLMAGRLGRAMLLGLPGNPVSSIVCGHLFMRPALRAMQGLGAYPMPSATATLTRDIAANGPRTHYMRARLGPDQTITPFTNQDSALLAMLADANALIVHPPHDDARRAGEQMRYIPL